MNDIATRTNLTDLLGTVVLDESGRMVGRVREVAMETDKNHDTVDALVVRSGRIGKKRRERYVPIEEIKRTSTGALKLIGNPVHTTSSMEGHFFLLERDLLDQQIIDVGGQKVVRVNDVDFIWSTNDEHLELRVSEVEVGLRGAVRRLLKGLAPQRVVQAIANRVKPRVIPWDFVDLIEVDPARRVHLKIEHQRLAQMHPSDIADILEELSPVERDAVFTTLDQEVAAEALEEVPPRLQKSLIQGLDSERVADIVEEMDPAAAADLLAELPDDRSEAILEQMEPAERREMQDLLGFNVNSAAGRMTTEYLLLNKEATVEDAVSAIRDFRDEPEHLTDLYLRDEEGRLVGIVPLARILLATPQTQLDTLAKKRFIQTFSDLHEDKVAELFDKYNLRELPVVSKENHLVGIIRADNIIGLLRSEQ
jgi:CBS domain-containing protein/sporulation protein YlmC with PRC-barrel domain